ncbi:MAG: glycosyltransferase family 39 protein [Kiritimatiellae bacterium]|nr:glycosyltransferase family 39 protein [Kiritimatiellia bacterium]
MYRKIYCFAGIVGLAISLWFAIAPSRLPIELVLVGLFFALRKKQWVNDVIQWLDKTLEANPDKSLAFVLAVGCVMRLAYVLINPGVLGAHHQLPTGDYTLLWGQAKDFARGTWPESKSWTTVVFFGFVAKLFGDSLVAAFAFASLLSACSALVAFDLAKRWFNKKAGLITAAFIFLSPFLSGHCGNVATEHTYVFFTLLALWAATLVSTVKSRVSTFVLAFACALVSFAAMWSRGEGVMLLIVLPIVFVVDYFSRHVRTVCGLLGMLVGIAFVCAIAVSVNFKTGNGVTIFSSNDNLWPRLFGASLEHNGRMNKEDCQMIWQRYKVDHPDCDWPLTSPTGVPFRIVGHCPKEIAPYVREETTRRWKSMSFGDMVMLFIKKEMVWWGNPIGYDISWDVSLIGHCVARLGGILFPAAIVLLAVMFFANFNRSSFKCSFVLFAPAIMLGMNFAILAVAEVGERYTVLLHVMWPLYAAAFVTSGLKDI